MIPILLLSPFSIIVSFNHAVDQANQRSLDTLILSKENLELMLYDVDFLSISFDNNIKNATSAKEVLRSSEYTYEIYQQMEFINGLLSIPRNSKPFIHSIYLYIDNQNGRFFSTNANQSLSLSNNYDITWYESYINTNPNIHQWVETRYAKSSSNDENPQKVVTLYRRLLNNKGIIVLNIKESYFYNMFEHVNEQSERSLIVFSAEGDLLFSSMLDFDAESLKIKTDDFPLGQSVSINIDGENQIMTMLKSEKFNWIYISIIPERILYSVPTRILGVTIAVLIFTTIIGLILAYWTTLKNYRDIMNIIDVFQAAEQGKPLPPMPNHIGNEYSYILQNITKTFIEQDYLKMQLSIKQLSLRNSELVALQSQLNPHFMFNILETINLEVLSYTKKPISANRMINELGLMLRYALDRKETVSLRQEIENTKRYINIQSYRYEDKFFVRWNVDDEAMDFQIIPLLLQPMIENSIDHGIKEKEGRCGIKLSIQAEQKGLHIRVTDDGIGITTEELSKIKYNLSDPEIDTGRHIGLYNTNKRLALTYGENYHIEIRSKYGIGTYIHIFIPEGEINKQKG